MAAVDYFLNVEGIPGESTDAQFPGWIEIESFSWGVTQTGTDAAGGGGGAGKAVPQDFVIVKRVDKASPKLFLSCATGQHIKEVVMKGRKSSTHQAYLEYKLTDVLVSSYQDTGNQGEAPLEQVSFNFAKIVITYQTTLPDGRPGPSEARGFDFKAQRSI